MVEASGRALVEIVYLVSDRHYWKEDSAYFEEYGEVEVTLAYQEGTLQTVRPVLLLLEA